MQLAGLKARWTGNIPARNSTLETENPN